MEYCRSRLVLLLLLQILLINALPPTRSQPLALLHRAANVTASNVLTKELDAFPPGPPTAHFFYPIPSNPDIILVFNPLGQDSSRDEGLVRGVIRDAISESLTKRISSKMPGHGWKLQHENFLLCVTHSVGASDLTWGMWTTVLIALKEYVQAYPRYNFSFDIRLVEGFDIEGDVIAAGFAMTRYTR
ncbi:MAG: hypothetical protein Q9219_001262 [cf. Caloplaca sp. 3 TL-2023]